MFGQGEMVTYKEFGDRLFGHCGIVEKIDSDKPGYVWVRWVGELANKIEKISDLEKI